MADSVCVHTHTLVHGLDKNLCKIQRLVVL